MAPPTTKAGAKPRRLNKASAKDMAAPTLDPRLAELANSRVAIEGVSPEIDGGRFPAKTVTGAELTVEADIFCDGHDRIDAALLFRPSGSDIWAERPMVHFDNDRWRGSVPIEKQAPYEFTLIGWRALFTSWREEVHKKTAAGLAVHSELLEGRALIEAALEGDRATKPADKRAFKTVLKDLDDSKSEQDQLKVLLADKVADLYDRAGPRTNLTRYDKILPIWVDRERAAFSAWYELMPRSQSGDVKKHGTFEDVIKRLPYIRDLGFDVLYMPPIHPIGTKNRKGKNNTLTPGPDDPGSPYAIGSKEGGHDALHPQLGDFKSFAKLVKAANKHGLDVAIDFAVQCAPDHPWIKEHPEWFDWRPDGTIKYAENPPKKYEDIVNVHFYRGALPSIWYALRDIVLFWAEKGVTIFRVDNPHTKPYPFWEWLIAEVQAEYPDSIFLAEAFTRPKVMKRLGKLGFTQSYSYFTWRNTKAELTEYLMELTREECRHFMRPNFFPNTPDINPHFLQTSGRPGFRTRLVLAATLGGNYGIYNGFELCEADPVPGREEYNNSEKYEIRAWDWDREGHIRDDIALVNRLRNEHPALRDFTNVEFYNAWDDNILYYGRRTPDLKSFILVLVNLDPHHTHGADFELPLWEFGLPDNASIGVENLVTGERQTWAGKIQHVHLEPSIQPYAIWRLIGEKGTA